MSETMTLAERMAGGLLPVADALRLATTLAESLRQWHEGGRIHGELTPATLTVTGVALELTPPAPGPAGSVTPYTAPELLRGRKPDPRTDIFAFGAILFEMLTGRRAFEGSGPSSLAANLVNKPVPATGSRPVDRVVTLCMEKNPDDRPPGMQTVIRELALLAAAARRAQAAAAKRASQQEPPWQVALREFETRLGAQFALRLHAHESKMGEAVSAVRAQISTLRAEAAARPEPSATAAGETVEAPARVESRFRAILANIEDIEESVQGIKQRAHEFERNVAADLADIGEGLKTQSAAIEAARDAMTKTDGLVERIVQALESLQAAVLEPGDPRFIRSRAAIN